MTHSQLPNDYRRLWLGQTISAFGSQVSSVALPLTAVLVLEATPVQMGWLGVFNQLPMILFGLLAGVLVDGVRRRPILIIGDFGRAAALITIPIAAYFGVLSFIQLCGVGFVVGSFSVVAAVADRAYLPSILGKDQLMVGNSRLWFSYSLAQTTGPGLAGALVHVLTAPIAILLDALSYVASGLVLLGIRSKESVRVSPGKRAILSDVRSGLAFVAKHPLLRPLVLCGGTHNIFSTMIVTVYFLYMSRELGIEPHVLGGILVAGGLGSMFGSTLASKMVNRLGSGAVLIVVQVLTGCARLLIPLAAGSLAWIVGLLVLSEFMLGAARSIFNITQISLRQSIIPPETLGRVNASIGFVLWALTPLGALAAGFCAEGIGMRETLWIASAGVLLSTCWIVFSQLRSFRLQ